MGHPPLMFRPAGGPPPDVPVALTITPVVDERTMHDFVATLVEAYPVPGGEGSPISTLEALGPIRLYVGYVDGRAVATSGTCVSHGLNDVEWVSTRAEYRRKGIGAALTWAASLAEPSLPAALIASDDGQGVYEAMGYVRVMRLTMWHRPPAD
jgi:GNAT superfamily N-acetyltransferase